MTLSTRALHASIGIYLMAIGICFFTFIAMPLALIVMVKTHYRVLCLYDVVDVCLFYG